MRIGPAIYIFKSLNKLPEYGKKQNENSVVSPITTTQEGAVCLRYEGCILLCTCYMLTRGAVRGMVQEGSKLLHTIE